MAREPGKPLRGRGAQAPVGNRFEPLQLEADHEHLAEDDILEDLARRPPTRFFDDDSQSVVTENSSPDIMFRYSVNPYRGCEHGCSYCYARPYHEFLGLDPAIDFESVILVKRRAPALLREWLARPRYTPETIAFSGVTDCYQPIERQLRLTRGCLEVAAECLQPVGIITKNAGVTRDIDVLQQLAAHGAGRVAISIPTLNAELSRKMEPRTSSPAARLRAIRELTDAGIPVQLMAAPVIPGLTDSELPAILAAAREAGAVQAGYTLLRLPPGVQEVFMDWLRIAAPESLERVTAMIGAVRGGKLNDSRFGVRHRGEGAYALQIGQAFGAFKRKLGYVDGERLNAAAFKPPAAAGGQQWLF
ncbi:Radical SAM superfamily protein [Posidoniimonas polymericola]|uniref:Radical SAM superfamily protein n=1 Tax=Posidoniimonas polymericola TaxID=2528002 RepID=A0A5C5ZFC1_9BACT|nr:PA0069 family radical SAM protein [Posidoniimonas polymericola]TWT85541.1 Radical SAM superfamily protein [Posidoniimonas polymericola]